MPIHSDYDPQQKILITTVEGALTFDDLDRHIDKRLLAGVMGHPELFDATAATTEMSTEELRKIAKRAQRIKRDGVFGPTAIVTDRDFVFGMARMFGTISNVLGGPEFAAFRSVNEARDWLSTFETQVKDRAPGA